ncbi:MAG: tetratricopeptide repeat protein [Candidatus Omnitrophica bacterium]|nr:tetratricopeptide repeat protein [Candidatus Omnitrophota bacterium]
MSNNVTDHTDHSLLSIKNKLILVVSGIFFSLILLEIVLRVGGFIFLSLQELNNLQAIYNKGAYRIMCLGESTTEGGGIGGAYPKELEIILNERNMGIRFSVINKGLSRIKTPYIVANLENNLNKYNPNMVIAMIGANDIGIEYYKGISDEETFLFKNIRAYTFLRTLWMHVVNKIKAKNNEISLMQDGSISAKPFENKTSGPIQHLKQKGYPDIKSCIEKGNYYVSKGQWNEANSLFLEAIKMAPENDELYVSSGECYVRQANYTQAEESLHKAIALNQKNETAHFELGLCYRLQHKLTEAKNQYEKIIKLNKKEYEAYIELAMIYWEEGNQVKLEEVLNQAIMVHPEILDAYIIFGDFYKSVKNYVAAEDIFKKALELCPNDSKAYIELGWTYAFLKKFDLAEGLFRKALQLTPENEVALRSLGGLYQTQGEYEKAEKYFEKADEIANRSRSTYCNPGTRKNYRKIKRILDERGIKLVCVQYPMRSIRPLKDIFQGQEGIVFVDNEGIFKERVAKDGSKKYFLDMFAGDFGHCTLEGNRLLAKNIADVILKQYLRK